MRSAGSNERREPTIAERELSERLGWFIKLRWFAAAGVLIMFLTSRYGLRIHYAALPILCTVGAMLLYNLGFHLYAVRIRPVELINRRTIEAFANVQISVDLIVLTVLIHFSGGLENPFAVFYLFHMIIASILLPRRDCYLQATLAAFLLNGLALLEYANFLPHVPLEGLLPVNLYHDGLYVFAECFAYTLTFYLTVYMATSITERLRERETEIERANIELMTIHEARSEVMRKVHHELRAPLAAIQSCLKLILDGFTGELNDKQRDMVARAERRTSGLLELVTDLLELSRLRRQLPRREMKLVNLTEALEREIADHRPTATKKGIALKQSIEPLFVMGEPKELQRLFANLLGNALKYTPEGGTVSVTAILRRGTVIVDVQDTGIGIPAEEQEHIFEEFYRTKEAKTMEVVGTGLGLAIAKRVAESHQGQIALQSKVGEGTTFTVTLPASEAS